MRSIFAVSAVALAVGLSGCFGGSDDDDSEESRAQDARAYTVHPLTDTAVYADYVAGTGGRPSFTAQAGQAIATDRWSGTLNGAAYRIEVPTTGWNGKLVMYAHGYRGTNLDVTVGNPSIRRWLITNGYAWAASSYSKNYYDVRAGIEDTNALALAFTRIAAENGRTLAAPTKTYITGHSMGGHIAAAAVEAETLATARNRVQYAGSVPMCGVTGDTALFDTFGALQASAQALTGQQAVPVTSWSTIEPTVRAALFASFPTPIVPTAGVGAQYASVVKNLTGGERPLFNIAYGVGSFAAPWGTFGGDGTINGVLNRSSIDTRGFTYQIDGDTAASATLNTTAADQTPAADANRLRRDGLRWIPKVNGQMSVPVVAIHTIGDLFVPFSMAQIYAQRTADRGNSQWLVQRAIRGVSHCDFTTAEQERAFADMIAWEGSLGTATVLRPAGDDVRTAATVAAPTYGCAFTNNTFVADDGNPATPGSVPFLRGVIVAGGGACPP